MTIPDSMVSALKGAAGVAVAVAFWEGIRALGVVDARDLPSFAAIIRTALTGLLGGGSSSPPYSRPSDRGRQGS